MSCMCLATPVRSTSDTGHELLMEYIRAINEHNHSLSCSAAGQFQHVIVLNYMQSGSAGSAFSHMACNSIFYQTYNAHDSTSTVL